MLAVDLVIGRPLIEAVTATTIFGLEATAAVWLLRRGRDQFSLSHFSNVARLVAVGLIVPMGGGVVAATLLGLQGDDWLTAWRTWALKDGVGILLAAPVVVAALTEARAALRASGIAGTLEGIANVALAAAGSVAVFGGVFGPVLQAPAYLLPFVIWAVFRFGVGGTAVNVLMLSMIGLWNTSEGRGPFALADAPIGDWILRSQGSMAIAAVSFLLMAATVADRRRVARENLLLLDDLQNALLEIKTLQGFIPLCAWCHKVRDDAGFWQQIESYLDTHTDATVSHSICPSCAETADREIAAHDSDTVKVERY